MDKRIPDDVMSGLKNAFADDPDSLARVLYFLAVALSENIAEPFITSLQGVLFNKTVFKKVAERMAEDTKTAEKDPQYRQLMYDVWNNFLKDSLTKHPDDGQKWELAIPPKGASDGIVVQYCFMRAVARLPPASYIAVANTVSAMSGPVAMYGGKALASARKALPVVRVALLTVFLAWNVIKNIKRWWNGEITGKRCVKNIIDCGVGAAAGIAGGVGGEMIGATAGAVFGPVGAAVGAVVGAVAVGAFAAITAETLSDRLT